MDPLPLVSIVMPVYNTAPFLEEAVKSILQQSFSDFEFIIIDDGSTDGSLDILKAFRDERIVLLSNGINRGLVFTLHRGLKASKGRYIARMDGDDISLPDRLKLQVEYMERHPQADLVTSFVDLIDEHGTHIGVWEDDRQHYTPSSIRSFLPANNSLAHPSVLAKAEIIRALGYRTAQPDAEDYDLWLRWASTGHSLHKIAEPLVLHRIRKGSFTRLRQQNVYLKNATTKRRFIIHELWKGRLNMFVCKTVLMLMVDVVRGVMKMAFGKKRNG
jgi:glycosyltransferase involved in cell wall biosynthesis